MLARHIYTGFCGGMKGKKDYLQILKAQLRGGINRSFAPNTHIPLAPPAEQKRIAKALNTFFERYFEVQSKLESIPKFIADFRQQILHMAVTGELTKDWRKKNSKILTAKEFLKRIILERQIDFIVEHGESVQIPSFLKDEALNISLNNNIPSTWSVSYLQTLGELTRGKSKHRPRNDPKLYNGRYPFIQTGDISASMIYVRNHKQTYNEIGLAQSRLFPINTLCITIAANIGETAILTYPACFPDSVVGFIPYKNMFLTEIALYYFNTIQKELEAQAPATAQKNINLAILGKLIIPVPPPKEQIEIINRVKKLFAIIDKIELRYKNTKEKLDQLPHVILNKAYSGKLVSPVKNDEPVEKLLERIKEEKVLNLDKGKKLKRAIVKREDKIKMEEKKKKDLLVIIKQHKGGISPEKLLYEANYALSEVDEFYAELKKIRNKIEEIKPSNSKAEWPDEKRVVLKHKG